jgi:predicted transcriptional regulator
MVLCVGDSPLKLFDIIERVTRKIAPGPAPAFNEAHVVKALEMIDKYQTVGRIKLSKEMGLGEGTTRTLLKHLKNEGVTQSSRSGISFSEEGKKLFSDLRSQLREGIDVPSSPLTVGAFNIAVLVRNAAQAIGSGMEQRDAAIKSGALGATTLIFSKNKLELPQEEENLCESMPELHNKLVTQLNPKENDVIIVGSGDNRDSAEIGAKMAAIKLLKSNN